MEFGKFSNNFKTSQQAIDNGARNTLTHSMHIRRRFGTAAAAAAVDDNDDDDA